MAIQLTIHAENGADFLANLNAIGARISIGELATEALISELRERMAKQGHAVNIDPVGELHAPQQGNGSGAAPAATASEPRRRGPGRSRAETQTPQPQAPTAAPQPGQPGQPAQPAQPAQPQSAFDDPAPGPSRDDVIKALNAYSEPRGGQVAGRQKMQEVCGVSRLQDVPPGDYGKLIAALV